MKLDISKVIVLDGQIERPIHDNYNLTKRPTCYTQENKQIVPSLEQISITDICKKIEESEITNCDKTLFDNVNITLIKSDDDLKRYLSDILVRFDTSPKYYTKEDYTALIRVLYKSLLYLYTQDDQQITIGDNLSIIAEADGHYIEFKNPIANSDSVVSEDDLATTIPSIEYLNKNYVLEWEEI